MIAMHKQV